MVAGVRKQGGDRPEPGGRLAMMRLAGGILILAFCHRACATRLPADKPLRAADADQYE
jgi:hypothetical protein